MPSDFTGIEKTGRQYLHLGGPFSQRHLLHLRGEQHHLRHPHRVRAPGPGAICGGDSAAPGLDILRLIPQLFDQDSLNII